MKISNFVLMVSFSCLLTACGTTTKINQNNNQTTTVKKVESATPAQTQPKVTETYKDYLTSEYDFDVNLPDDWKMAKVKVYPNGYAKFYNPTTETNNNQRLVVHFFKDEKTTPQAFFEKAKAVTAQLKCEVEKSKVKQINADTVTFGVTSQKCPSTHDLIQIYKAFVMPDGLYTITYRAKLKNTAKEQIANMSRNVENAEIIPKS